VRREAVDRARLELAAARANAEQQRRSLHGARAALLAAERALRAAQTDFARATSVFELRAAEQQLARRRDERAETEAVVHRCEPAHAAAQAALQERERALIEAELGRRAVERKLTQRAVDVGRRTERTREDEADDVLRATRSR
jgi:hypothetical protein